MHVAMRLALASVRCRRTTPALLRTALSHWKDGSSYCTCRRKLLATMHFVNQFRPYLYGCKVLSRTDHASVKYIKTMNNPGDQSARWIECLDLYNTIEVRSGVKNCNADALSPSDEVHEVCEKSTGKRCVCVGIAELEKEEMDTTGALIDNWTSLQTQPVDI